jgi:methionyl-tRNA formyltransferase
VCNPDRPQGRKKIITPPPTKRTAETHQIPVYQPEKKPDPEKIRSYVPDADLFLVCAYSKIIPQSVLDIPLFGTIGIHPSLLPELRGASPIQSALLEGCMETGVTLYRMDAEVDHGDMIDQERCDITLMDTTPSLSLKLAHLASSMLIRDIPKILQKEIEYVPQDHVSATYTKKFRTDDAYISWEDIHRAKTLGGEVAFEIHRKIRGFYGDPGAWTKNPEGKRIKLWESEIQDGKLKLKVIQEEGKQKTVI